MGCDATGRRQGSVSGHGGDPQPRREREIPPLAKGAPNKSPPCEGGVGGVWGWLARATLPGDLAPPESPLRKAVSSGCWRFSAETKSVS